MTESFGILLILIAFGALCMITIQPAKASGDFWAEKSPIPDAKSNFGAATVNGRIYAVGGHIYQAVTGSNYEYDSAEDTWTLKRDMPTPRAGFGIAVYQNKNYVIGGRLDNNSVTGVNEVYDPVTDTWENRTPMPIGRFGLQANVVGGKIYLISGFPGPKSPATILNDVYDPSTDTWTTKSPIPTAVAGYGSAVVDGKIYVIGGGNLLGQINLSQIYDTETDAWSSGVPPPLATNGAVAATTGLWAPKLIYLIGGTTTGNTTNVNQVFDPQNNTWSMEASMPNDRVALAVAVLNDTIYAIGGNRGIIHGDPISPGNFANVTSNVSYDIAVNEQYFPSGYRGPIPPSTIPYSTPSPSPSPIASPSPTQSPSTAVPEFTPPLALVLAAATCIIAVALKKRIRRKLTNDSVN